MNAINARMIDFGIAMGTLNTNMAIPPYSGKSKYFQNWVKAIEKQAMLDHLNDEGIKRLTFLTSKGAVSVYGLVYIAGHFSKSSVYLPTLLLELRTWDLSNVSELIWHLVAVNFKSWR